jgi:hypothetical protein
MGKWLEKLKNKNPTNKEPTEPTKEYSVGSVGSLPLENQKSIGRERQLKKVIAPSPPPFEKSRKNANLTVDEPAKPTEGRVTPINVFKRTPLPDGLIVCMSCIDHPHCWMAHRAGMNTPKGHGKDQYGAILALEALEKKLHP